MTKTLTSNELDNALIDFYNVETDLIDIDALLDDMPIDGLYSPAYISICNQIERAARVHNELAIEAASAVKPGWLRLASVLLFVAFLVL
jgi:hypothetical protein